MIAQFLRQYGLFIGGSALGAAVDYAVTLTAVRVAGLDPALGLGLAMLLSASAAFFWHQRLTFAHSRGAGTGRRYLAFMAWSALIFALRAALMTLLTHWGLRLEIALAVAIVAASAVNFLVSRAVIFRNKGAM